MKDLDELSKRMKSDWDRRIQHDYRFWMSDGWSSDEVMWASGERDLQIILQDLPSTNSWNFLEIGCGVGRLLRSAAKQFSSVTGLDVSVEAIKQAKHLLSDCNNVNLICGNGVDLSEITSNSLDCVISYAALTSMPTDVIASYLKEIQRVVKTDGIVRLQVYIGQEQPVHSGDTLHLRCYPEERLRKALELSGFEVQWLRELKLPFQVSFKEVGIEAVIVSLRKTGEAVADLGEISKTLLPQGEPRETEVVENSALEYWMSVNYAKELADLGLNEKARETLEYASLAAKNAAIDIGDSLQSLIKKFEQADVAIKPAAKSYNLQGHAVNSEVYEKNLKALKDNFSEVWSELQLKLASINMEKVQLKETEQGPVIIYNGQCLDHMTKPESAAANWVKQVINSQRLKDAKHLTVFGLGSGYHIQQLLDAVSKDLIVIEPSWEVFISILKQRDLSSILLHIKGLHIGEQDLLGKFEPESELLVRPQSQLICPEFYQKVRAGFYGARGLSTLKPKIAVLGPLAGGTLPIMGYCSLGLQIMKQRVREIDMSGFGGGVNHLEQLINNDLLRATSLSGYVEMLSKIIVNSHTEKPFDILLCMAQAPISGEALTELRKRGVITVLWFVEDYLRFTAWKNLAPYFDFMFTIQRGECIKQIKNAGCPEVHYLPTACDPLVHSQVQLSAEERKRWGSPVSFVGAGYHNRQQMFARLASKPFKIWGTEWPTCKPFDRMVQEEGRRLTPAEYVKIFNATTINLNLHSSTERDGIDPSGDFLNPRVFELASCQAFQLTDPRVLLSEVFTPGEDIALFHSADDLRAKIDYYLNNEEERQAIAVASQKTVREKHTYVHRLNEMLSIIYSSRYEQLKAREEQQPWKQIIKRADTFPELKKRCEAAFSKGEEPCLDSLVAEITTGKGQLSDTEMRLLFLYHVSQNIIRHKREEAGA